MASSAIQQWYFGGQANVVDADVDTRRAVAADELTEGVPKVVKRGDSTSMATERHHHRVVIGVGQEGAHDSLLPAWTHLKSPRRAPSSVVHHHDSDGHVMANHRLELAKGEAESAITDDADGGSVGMGDAGSHGKPQAAAHTPETSVGEVPRPRWQAKGIVQPVFADGAIAHEPCTARGRRIGDRPGRSVGMQSFSVGHRQGVELLARTAPGIGHGRLPTFIDMPSTDHVTLGGKRNEHGVGIAEQGQCRRMKPRHLRRVGVDMHDIGGPTGTTVAQPGRVEARLQADGEDHVWPRPLGKSGQLIQRATVGRVVVGERSDGPKVNKTRHSGSLGEVDHSRTRRAGGRVSDQQRGSSSGPQFVIGAAMAIWSRPTWRPFDSCVSPGVEPTI